MKTYLFTLILIVVFETIHSQTWKPLGASDFNQPSIGYGNQPTLAIDRDGKVYVAFQDLEESRHATVRRFNGITWEAVGEPGFSETFSSIEIKFDPNNIPYTAYWDEFSAQSYLKKYNGITWETIEKRTHKGASDKIALDRDGILYIVYRDSINNDKATVEKFDGSHWEVVGNAGFTSAPASIFEIITNVKNQLYVGNLNYLSGNRFTVSKYNGLSWEDLGNTQLIKGVVLPRMVIDSEGSPYVAYSDSVNGYKATVIKFNGHDWETVGKPGFSSGQAFPDIAITPNGTPYVAYIDSANGYKATVMNLEDNNWKTTGNTGFSDTKIPNSPGVTIAIDSVGIPWVAYADSYPSLDENLYKIRVKKLKGNIWENIGSEDITSGMATAASLAVAPSGTTYIAYYYDNYIAPSFEHWHKTGVAKWNNNSWEKVGNADNLKGTDNVNLAMAPDGTLYMAFSDSVNDYKATVIRYNGSNWETVGIAGFSSSNAAPVMAIDSAGTIYVTYSESALGNKTTVMKFNGNKWEKVESDDFSESALHPLIAIDKTGIPYITYADGSNGFRVIVKRFNGNHWETLGNEDFSGGDSYPFFITIDTADQPYIAYRRMIDSKYRMKKFNGNTWESIDLEEFPIGSTEPSFVLDSKNRLYIGYADNANDFKATASVYIDNQWKPIGNPGFSAGRVDKPLLKTDKKGSLYMVFSSGGGWAYTYQIDELNPNSHEISETQPIVKSWPNPFSNRLNIEFISPTNTHAKLEIMDGKGSILALLFDHIIDAGQSYQAEYNTVKKSTQLLFYRLTLGNQTFVGKLIQGFFP